MVQFVAALRAAGVRTSLAETADAFAAVNALGVHDRETFRLAMRATLVKEARHLPVFDELFAAFFAASAAPAPLDLSQDLSPEDIHRLTEALQQFNDRLRQLLEHLLRGEPLSREELERLGKLVGLGQSTDMHYQHWMAQRMERALGFRELRDALQELAQLLDQLGMDRERVAYLRELLQANQQALEEQIEQFSGQRIAENMSQLPRVQPGDDLLNRPFDRLSERDMDAIRKEVQRLAAALRTRVALRQRRARSGQLDAKATIRANLKHGSVPIEIKHRKRSLKPKLVVLCDISTSMRPVSEMMLSLVYALQDQIHKTHAFAFIDHLEYISPDFTGRQASEAVAQVLERMPSGHYNTDLGYSLKNFSQDYLGLVDSHTTLILVGDGRNNYSNPRADLLNMLARRARKTIWLNPEPPSLWGSGDSDMLQYAPYCDITLQVNCLAQLAAAVDRLLTLR